MKPSIGGNSKRIEAGRNRWIGSVAALFLLAIASPLAAQFDGGFLSKNLSGQAKGPPSHTTIELLADTAAIEPGVPFRLGVHYTLDPHWHTYWRTAGEVGYEISIDWTLPEGFKAGRLQWPNPVRLDDKIAGVSYVYQDEVLLFAVITPPARLEPGSKIELSAASEWLSCEINCIPGDGEAALELPVGKAARSESADLFDRFASRVPRPLAATAPVRVTMKPDTLELEPGAEADVETEIKTTGAWRIALGPGAEGAQLYPDVQDNLSLTHPTAPEAASEETIEGKRAAKAVTFRWKIEAEKSAKGGEIELSDALRLPLINAETGKTRTLHVALNRSVTISGAAGDRKDTQPTVAGAGAPNSTGAQPPSVASPDDGRIFSFLPPDWTYGAKEHNLLIILLFAFIGGLILNAMPCVLPVLSIKVLSFVNQAGEDPKRIFKLGLVFAAGVFFTFAIMAALVVGVKSAGAEIGWGFQLQEPRFVIVMSAIVFAFGLSLFGVYEVGLPGSATSNLDALQRREGPAGAFMNGMLATILATPCTAPFLAPALGFAFSQSAPIIFLTFGMIAAGLASPYLLLSAYPGWLKFVPRPGPWMETFKQSMGLLLMATVIWLLYVLGQQAGPEEIIWTLCFLLALGVGCALIGRGMDFSASAARRWTSLVIAVALTVGSYFYFPDRHLKKLAASEANGGPGNNQSTWQPFSLELIESLAAQNKTIFVDFTADWCATCKTNEGLVLNTAAIEQAFRDHKTELIRADYTRRDPLKTRILNMFGRAGVPMYIIFPAGRPDEPILLPTALTPGIVKDGLAEAAGGEKIALAIDE